MNLFVESLEARIAPATLIDAKTVSFFDTDGDTVTVKISKGSFDRGMFTFDNGAFNAGPGPANTAPQVLESLNLSFAQFSGANLTIEVTKATAGDGSVDIGAIIAANTDLGKVSIEGNLVKIDAGDLLTPSKGLAGLKADSLGVLDPTDFDLGDRTSTIYGKLGDLTLAGDLAGALVSTGGNKSGIGKISIGGSLLAGAGDLSGSISSTGSIGSVFVGGNIDGSLADTANEASISSRQSIGNVTVNGSVIAGAFESAGSVRAFYHLGDVRVTGSVGDTATGVTAGTSAGSIVAEHGKMKSVFIGGNLVGGEGMTSGYIGAEAGLGKVQVNGSLKGAAGENSGSIMTFGALTSLTIGGSLEGSSGKFSGSVNASQKIGTVSVGADIIGGTAEAAGSIMTEDSMAKVTVGGDITGGTALNTGAIVATENMGAVTVDGKVQGGAGEQSGSITAAFGKMGAVVIGEGLIGASGSSSGAIKANESIASFAVLANGVAGGGGDRSGSVISVGKIGAVSLPGDLIGGGGDFSGRVASENGSIKSVSVGGNLAGGAGDNGGTIYAGGDISTVKVTGSMTGGTGDISGSIGIMRTSIFDGLKASGKIGSVSIGTATNQADVTGGAGVFSGAIVAFSSINSVSIAGDLVGGTGASSGLVQTNGSLGEVKAHDVRGGQAANSGRVYAETSLNKISLSGSLIGGDYSYAGSIIGGTSIGSVAIAGRVEGGDNAHGNTERTGAILSGKIGSVLIGGDLKSGERVDNAKSLTDSGAIRAVTTIGSVKVLGSIEGNEEIPVLIAAQLLYGPVNANITIGSVEVTENVSHALILAGVNLANPPGWTNPFAQIKSVVVGGDWTASSISAGAKPGPNGYGVGDVVSPNGVAPGLPTGNFSKIGKISIGGVVEGGEVGDQYGFVASNFGTITVGSQTIPSPIAGGSVNVIPGGDVKIHRLPTNPA